MTRQFRLRKLALASVMALLAGCAVGPDYVAPSEQLESSFKNAGFSAPVPEGSWWKLFNDPELNRLVRQAGENGPTARAALARYDQARAALGIAAADAYPSATGEVYARRQSNSGNSAMPFDTYNEYRAALNLSWEIDLWGRVRRQVGAASADVDSAAYEYDAVLLSLRAEVARSYLTLRFQDAEIALLEETADLRAEARRLMGKRFDAGSSSRIDLERTVTEHERIKSELEQLRAGRARNENALAALIGRSASGFRISPRKGSPDIPAVPGGVPSDLLRRRPDLAVAERRLAAASERIGLAIAKYLPRVTLNGSGGVASMSTSDLFNSSSNLWSLGPGLEIPVLQGGRVGAEQKIAEAGYREALENYRSVLVKAIQETEDSMGDARRLSIAATSQARAADSAGKAAELVRERYKAGTSDYFEVVESERVSLEARRREVDVQMARALAAARLIQALGGGWQRR